jgi:hypothetical protein
MGEVGAREREREGVTKRKTRRDAGQGFSLAHQ